MPRTRSLLRLAVWCSVILSCGIAPAQHSPAPSDLAPTPPMGWASWNRFFCDYNERTIREQADALVSTGMRDLGYKYVLIQECIAPKRDASGELIVDTSRFPHGMKRLVDYVHSRGLKAGTYTDVGPYTCFPGHRYQGSYGHEVQDAQTFASWGMDFVEMDYCNRVPAHTGREVYERMATAIQATGRPMLFYICSWGNESPWTWAQGKAQLWRTDADISGQKDRVAWADVIQRFESNASHAIFSAPNSWNDPDMLEVGNAGLNAVEAQTHFAMWAISAAPLWAGNDLTDMSTTIRGIYSNPEVIAVDQDSLGAGVFKVKEDAAGLEVWAKPLGSTGSGADAVLLLNLTDHEASITVPWRDLGLTGNIQVRDLYLHRDVKTDPEFYRATLPAHGSALLKMTGTYDWPRGIVYEAEWPGNSRSIGAILYTCPSCSHGYAVSLNSPNGAIDMSSLTFTHITVPESGTYQLMLNYVDNPTNMAKLDLQVNAGTHVSVPLHGVLHGIETLPVALHAGDNQLTFSYAGATGTAVHIDRIRIYASGQISHSSTD